MGSAYYDSTGVSPEKRKDDLQVLSLCTWAFVRSMKRHLSPADEDEEDFRTELLEKLPGPQALKIIRAAHRPNRALQDLSTAIENLPMHFMRKNEVHKAVTIFEGGLLFVSFETSTCGSVCPSTHFWTIVILVACRQLGQ